MSTAKSRKSVFILQISGKINFYRSSYSASFNGSICQNGGTVCLLSGRHCTLIKESITFSAACEISLFYRRNDTIAFTKPLFPKDYHFSFVCMQGKGCCICFVNKVEIYFPKMCFMDSKWINLNAPGTRGYTPLCVIHFWAPISQ